MPEVSSFAKFVVATLIVVVVGVFIGLTACAHLHPPQPHETFASCPAKTTSAKPKCVRVVSTASPPPPPTIVVATKSPQPTPSSAPPPTTQATTSPSSAPKSCPSKATPQACPKSVYCPPCPKGPAPCPRMCPDMSKYVMKTSIPPCPEPKVDRDIYMLKSDCKQPDMSKYVLKSSLPSYKAPPCPPCVCKYEPNSSPSSSPSSSSSSTSTSTQSAPNAPPTSNATTGATTTTKETKTVNKDLFGGDGLLGNSNMSAWNDTGATGGSGIGASLHEPSTITGSCAQ